MLKRKRIAILGSTKFEKEIRLIGKILKKANIKVETRNSIDREPYCKWLRRLRTFDIIILYNKDGYISCNNYDELLWLFQFNDHPPILAYSNKYFNFKIASDETIKLNTYLFNQQKVDLPGFYFLSESELIKRKVLIITTKANKKYYQTYWKNRCITDSNLMIEDITKEKDIYPIPLIVDVIMIDNIETNGFISKIAYEYIYTYINTPSYHTECYLSTIPKWDLNVLDIDESFTFRDSFVLKHRHKIKEFGNQEFFKLERR